MGKWGSMKIKSMLQILLEVFVAVILLLQLLYFAASYKITFDNSKKRFSITTQILNDNISTYISQIEKEIRDSMVKNDLSFFLRLESSGEQMEQLDRLTASLRSLISTNQSVAGALLIGSESGPRVFENKREGIIPVYYRMNKNYFLFDMKEDKETITGNYYDSYTKRTYFAYIVPIYDTVYYGDGKKMIGKLVIMCDTHEIENRIKSVISGETFHTYVIDEERILASASDQYQQEFSFEKLLELTEAMPQYTDVTIEGVKYFVNISRVDSFDWYIINIVPKQELTKGIRGMFMVSFMMTLVILGGIVFVSRRIMQGIMTPVHYIMDQLKIVSISSTHYRIPEQYQNEVGVIIGAINEMLGQREEFTRKIFNTQQQLYETELYKNETELMFLQAQINPHFLYNTLECVRSMAEENHIQPIQEIMTSMSRILRYAAGKKVFVPLREELQCVRDYMKIMLIRYGDCYDFGIYVQDDLRECGIIKMILQPLVENSVNHGLWGWKNNGKVIICIQKKEQQTEQMLEIRITDTGRGMEPELLETLRGRMKAQCNKEYGQHIGSEQNQSGHRSIGLNNIYRRLLLNYDGRAQMEIRSKAGIYTQIRIIAPVMPAEP